MRVSFSQKLGFFFLGFLVFPSFLLAQSTESFFVNPQYDLYERERLLAVKILETERGIFWIEKPYWISLSSFEKQEILSKLQEVGRVFDSKIYPVLTSLFGKEWSPGIDNNPKIHFLFHRTKEGPSAYFMSKDEYYKYQDPTSNEKELLYISASMISSSKLAGILSHEFLHLISFNKRIRLLGSPEERWLEETRAEIGVYLVFGKDILQRKQDFIRQYEDSLTEWKDLSQDYAVGYVFGRYLLERFTPRIFTKTLDFSGRGIESLERYWATQRKTISFSKVFSDFLKTIYLNDCSVSEIYCFASKDLQDLRVIPNTIYLPAGGEITLSLKRSTKDWTPKIERIIGGSGDLRITFKGESPATFKLDYVLEKKNGSKEVGEIQLSQDREGSLLVRNFSQDYKALVLFPIATTKNRYFSSTEPYRTYTLTLQTAPKLQEVQTPSLPPQTNPSPSLPEPTLAEIQQRIRALQEEIKRLQNLISRLLSQKRPVTPSCQITKNLYYGIRDKEVACLQEFLKSQGPEIYPEGLVTGYFGPLTLQAVKRFQLKYKDEILTPLGLTEPTGFVGPMTRKKIGEIIEKITFD